VSRVALPFDVLDERFGHAELDKASGPDPMFFG
jgi:hypothetical protein